MLVSDEEHEPSQVEKQASEMKNFRRIVEKLKHIKKSSNGQIVSASDTTRSFIKPTINRQTSEETKDEFNSRSCGSSYKTY